MEIALFTLKVRMLKSEVMETLLCGCVTWTLGVEHFAVLHGAHRKLLLWIIGFNRRQSTDHCIPYAKALKKAQCAIIETTIHKPLLVLPGPYSGQTVSD